MLNRPGTYEWNCVTGRHPNDTRLLGTLLVNQFLTVALNHCRVVVHTGFLGDYVVQTWSPAQKAALNVRLALHDRRVGKL